MGLIVSTLATLFSLIVQRFTSNKLLTLSIDNLSYQFIDNGSYLLIYLIELVTIRYTRYYENK